MHDLHGVAVGLAARLLVDECGSAVVVLPEQLECGHPAAVDQLDLGRRWCRARPRAGCHRPADREVVAERVGLDHREHQGGGAHLQQVRDVAVVGVTEDDVQPAVAVGDGVRLVAGLDEGALEGGLEADLDLEEVAALGDLVAGGARVDPDADPA